MNCQPDEGGRFVETLDRVVLTAVVPLLVIHIWIGVWNWKLAFDGCKIRRDSARIKAQHALVLERIQVQRKEILDKFGEVASPLAYDTDRLGRDTPRELNPPAVPAQRSSVPFKLGIALSGGGGKGAYQVGVLRVLRAAGLQPDVIAGTSVGAINAAMLCLDDVEVAADFWSTVSFWQVAKVGVANLAAAPLLLFAIITAGSSDDIDERMRRTILLRYYALLLPANILAIYLGSPWLGVVASVVGCATVVTLGLVADSLVGRLGLALLNNAPLAAQIHAKASPAQLRAARTPLYVTVAARRRIIDPGMPHWLDRRRRILVARQPYVPEYRRLQDEPEGDIARIVLQSAAIPFGVFPLRRIGRSGYVDGGVADNVPIQPLIDAGCTRIVVIHLSPRGDCDGWRLTNPDDLWARLGQLRELRRLAVLGGDRTPEDLAHEARLRESLSPDLQRQARSADVRLDYGRADVTFVHIVPSQSLGNFLTGTMNFSARKARRLIELGEHDARLLLGRSVEFAARTS
jgi:predicted acylesterase/phospholipase RssA